MSAPTVDELPGVCSDCIEDDHCGDDRCWCCEEADCLLDDQDDVEDCDCGCSTGEDWTDGLIAYGRPVLTLQPSGRYL